MRSAQTVIEEEETDQDEEEGEGIPYVEKTKGVDEIEEYGSEEEEE